MDKTLPEKLRGRCFSECKRLDRRSGIHQDQYMPRQARLDVPGALHHVMVRGINKSAIFKDDQDKARFLRRLGDIYTGIS